MRRTSVYICAAASVTIVPLVARAQNAPPAAPSKIDSVLAAGAHISLDSARVLALHKVPNGHVAAEELEREHGRLIYSFDVRVPGKSGINEVNVDARHGKVLSVHHESAAAEAKEAHDDSVAAKKAATSHSKPTA